MFEIKLIRKFSAAHNLRNYRGKCEKLHGHNWKVETILAGECLDKSEMLFDFTEAKKLVDAVLSEFDHNYLNRHYPFDQLNPTSENIAKYIFESIQKKLKKIDRQIKIRKVTVWESDNQAASFYETTAQRPHRRQRAAKRAQATPTRKQQ